jgi:hypothetical protein
LENAGNPQGVFATEVLDTIQAWLRKHASG